jgi:hypothetical protein
VLVVELDIGAEPAQKIRHHEDVFERRNILQQHSSSVSSAAAMTGNAAFFAPEIGTRPVRRCSAPNAIVAVSIAVCMLDSLADAGSDVTDCGPESARRFPLCPPVTIEKTSEFFPGLLLCHLKGSQ